MWLFTGRYRELGPAICVIALFTASIGAVFLVIAVRLLRRSDLDAGKVVSVLLPVGAITLFSEMLGFGEQVFIPPNSLNRDPLLVAIGGTLIGIVGVFLSKRIRMLRVLILLIAAGVLFGGVTGWSLRSAGISKYDYPTGMLDLPGSTGGIRVL